MEEAARLDKNDFERALASLLKDYAGEDLFNENMRRNAELLRRHVQSARAGRLPADKAMLPEILQARTGKEAQALCLVTVTPPSRQATEEMSQ